MGYAKVLDCTLRDGAYLLDKKFGDASIKGIIGGLVKSKIDYIEIGFFQDDEFGPGKTVFRNSADAKRFIPQDKNGCQFTVLADYSRFSVENLDVNLGDSVDVVRECFFKHERYDAIEACKVIKAKGYKVFVQPVDILGYTDKEILELVDAVNELEPHCLSIVDTFGSMYMDDMRRLFDLINHNLTPSCRMGFHSHNNMQMSNALSQEFINIAYGKREIVVDTTLCGMGRGAGNTPTELVVEYMVSKMNESYDMDAILDTIDQYMDNIRTKCTWGYSTPYFIAGAYSAHVNNIAYLTEKNSIRSKDVRYILNKIGQVSRKRYDYDLLEKTYYEYLSADVDDTLTIEHLRMEMQARPIVLMAPGKSALLELDNIRKYVDDNKALVISVNFIHPEIESDYVFFSNVKRYQYWSNTECFSKIRKILTSNVVVNFDNVEADVVSFVKLIKCGWENLDNAMILLLRLLDRIGIEEVNIAGFDGYSIDGSGNNFVTNDLNSVNAIKNAIEINKEIVEMLQDFMQTSNMNINYITQSRFNSRDER